MKAWTVDLWDFPQVVIYGETRGKAIYGLWLRSLSDSYRFSDVLKSIQVLRSPENDTPPITTGTRVMHRHSKQVGTVEGVEGDKALVKYERWVGGPYPVSIASLDVVEVEG